MRTNVYAHKEFQGALGGEAFKVGSNPLIAFECYLHLGEHLKSPLGTEITFKFPLGTG